MKTYLSQLPEGGKTTEGKDCVEDVYIWARNKLELSLTGSKVKGMVRLLPIHSELFHVVPAVPSLEPETMCFWNSGTDFPTLWKHWKQPGFHLKGSLFDSFLVILIPGVIFISRV